jgi:hypothetical protein
MRYGGKAGVRQLKGGYVNTVETASTSIETRVSNWLSSFSDMEPNNRLRLVSSYRKGRNSVRYPSIVYPAMLVLTEWFVEGVRRHINQRRIRRIPKTLSPSLITLGKGPDYSRFTLMMMVPGMNTTREPARTSPVANLPLLLLLRALPLPKLHGRQTSRPAVQNGGMARNGLRESGLMSIRNGVLVTMAICITGNVIHWIWEHLCLRGSHLCTCFYEPHSFSSEYPQELILEANRKYSHKQLILLPHIRWRKQKAAGEIKSVKSLHTFPDSLWYDVYLTCIWDQHAPRTTAVTGSDIYSRSCRYKDLARRGKSNLEWCGRHQQQAEG